MKSHKPPSFEEFWFTIVDGVLTVGTTGLGQVTETEQEVFECGPEPKVARKLESHKDKLPSKKVEQELATHQVNLETAEEPERTQLQIEIVRLTQELAYHEGFKEVDGVLKFKRPPSRRPDNALGLVQTLTVTLGSE